MVKEDNPMEMVTAVLAGNNALELRLFAEEAVPAQIEQTLTRRLCRLMDAFQEDWRR